MKQVATKVSLFLNRMEYLEHILVSNGLAGSSQHISAIKTAVFSTDWAQVILFLGVCNTNRKCIRYFSRIAWLLNEYVQKEKKLERWDLTIKALDAL